MIGDVLFWCLMGLAWAAAAITVAVWAATVLVIGIRVVRVLWEDASSRRGRD